MRQCAAPCRRPGASTKSWRVETTLDEFDTPEDLRHRPIAALSGGWQRLALLARAWITEPDALLLDEPTNHLDAEKIARLEAWIAGPAARTPMLIASHDRTFLDTATTRTLFLRPGLSRLYAHPYSTARQLLAEDDAAQDRKHAKDAKEVDRLRRNAGELRNIGVNSGSDLLQKKSMQLRERAARLEQTLRPAHTERSGTIRLGNSGSHAKILAAFRDLVVTTPDGQSLFRIEKFDLRQGDRLVLLGRNGVGKSQLLGLIRRAASAAVPGVVLSASVVLGYADQGMTQLPGRQTPHRFIAARTGIGDGRATGLLAEAGFTVEAQTRPIDLLSPGQKARLGLLALRLAAQPLCAGRADQPRGHPGPRTAGGRAAGPGATCILVSHDRSFVAAVGTRVLTIEGGRVREM